MIYGENFKMTTEDCGAGGFLTIGGALRLLETVGAYHADSLGNGLLDTEKTGIAWVLLEWRVEMLRAPAYGERLTARTWSRGRQSAITSLRDYELLDEEGRVCVLGSSKWTLLDLQKKRIVRISDEMEARYGGESRSVFGEADLVRLREPSSYERETKFAVRRTEMDANGHLHNLYYLNYALESLPEDVYDRLSVRELRITYRKEIRPDEPTLLCRYHGEGGVHTVGLYGDDGTLRALVELKESLPRV